MFKNGKVFGKINLFDAVILLLLIILIIAGLLKFKTFNQKIDAGSSGRIVYTFDIFNVRDYTLGSLKSGDQVFDSQTGNLIGKIINIEEENALEIKSLANGKTVLSENPYKKDIVLTIETPGSNTENGFFANRSIELKVGSEKKIETLYALTEGKIGSIQYFEE